MPAPRDPSSTLDSLAGEHGLDSVQRAQLGALVERLAADTAAPTAIRDPLAIVDRHVADSLSGLAVDALDSPARVADVGAGAGLPGLAVAIARPGARVALIESMGRKCDYLRSVIAALGLENVEVVHARAEAWADGLGCHDAVLARAVGPQPVVLEYAAPLLGVGGAVIDWRGKRIPGEETASARAASELGLEAVAVLHVRPFAAARDHHLHVFRKLAPTPGRFPRRPGVAQKRPLGA